MRQVTAVALSVFALLAIVPCALGQDGDNTSIEEEVQPGDDASMGAETRYEAGSSDEAYEYESPDGIGASIQDYMDSASDAMELDAFNRRLRISPWASWQLVYDDNIYLNAKDEPYTSGRVEDVISDLVLGAALDIRVNPAYTKIFKRSKITLLSYELQWLKYFDNSEQDYLNQNIRTDLFGLLNDIASVGYQGKNVMFELSAGWSRLQDPMNIIVNDLGLGGVVDSQQVEHLRRDAVDAHVKVGYLTNRWDTSLAYDFYWIDFDEEAFVQANHKSHTFSWDVGYKPEGYRDMRVYFLAKYMDLKYDEALLNDARVYDALLGFEGTIISKRFRWTLEGGYRYWDSRNTGVSGDTSDYKGGVGTLKFIYRPSARKAHAFQAEIGRTVTWTPIANYRVNDGVRLQYFHEILRKKLTGDASFFYGHYKPTEGPIRDLYVAGVGLTYHWLRQVDVKLRYLYRKQDGRRELNYTAVDENGNLVPAQTDSSFYQNVLSLGIFIRL